MDPNFDTNDFSMLLSIQMVADPLEEMLWEFTSETAGDTACLRGCQVYCGQSALRADTLYLIPEGMGRDFPADSCRYVACDDIRGTAPHICGLHRPFYEIMNEIMSVFQRYHDFEMRLNQIINGGTLVELCRAGCEFFRNPTYIHDNMFSVIALSSKVEGMLQFEYNEKNGKLYVPLWLINEFKYDESYRETFEYRSAALWDNTHYPQTMRSLYVNLYSGNTYRGRLLINELASPLQPGQYQAAVYLAKYAVRLIEQSEGDDALRYWGMEDTFTSLMNGTNVDNRDFQTTLGILDWRPVDTFLCIKIRSQDETLSVRPDTALNNALSSQIQGYFSFSYQKALCIVINLTRPGTDRNTVRQILAPLIRDSCMYAGISNPTDNIRSIHIAFRQADIALQYIAEENVNQWIVSFNECALHYIRARATQEFPAEAWADPALLKMLRYDKAHDTQYFVTLRSYLINERNIPRTADSLIIHRTTLTYRLQKIRELFNLPPDDDRQRLYLLMSLFLLSPDEYDG